MAQPAAPAKKQSKITKAFNTVKRQALGNYIKDHRNPENAHLLPTRPVEYTKKYSDLSEEQKRNATSNGYRWKMAAEFVYTSPWRLAAVTTVAFLGFIAQQNERTNPSLHENWTNGDGSGLAGLVGGNRVASGLQKIEFNDVGFGAAAGFIFGSFFTRMLAEKNLPNGKNTGRMIENMGRAAAVIAGIGSVVVSRIAWGLPDHGHNILPANDSLRVSNLAAGAAGGILAATAIGAYDNNKAKSPVPEVPGAPTRAERVRDMGSYPVMLPATPYHPAEVLPGQAPTNPAQPRVIYDGHGFVPVEY